MNSDNNLTSEAHTSIVSDSEVIERVLKGQLNLFEIIMRRYNRRLYRVVRSVLGTDEDIEDVMQTAYMKAYTHLEQFAGRASLSTWLIRIAIHEALARRKRKMAGAVADGWRLDALASKQPGPLEQTTKQETVKRIHLAIDALPAAYRVVFVMREVEGVSTEDTARGLQVSQDVVKSRLYRAKAYLRRALQVDTRVPRSCVYPFHLLRCNRVVVQVFRRIETPPVAGRCRR